MSIRYNGLFKILKKKNMSIYKLKSDKVIGTATLDKIRKNEGHIDTKSLENLCRYLECQPGDLLEYVPD
jgi:DNA-binding Xre family transcriptional regulator